MDPVGQVCVPIYVVRATSAKVGLHAGSMKFNTQTEERINRLYDNDMHTFALHLSVHHVQ
jgi:hypothetical protein